MRVTGPVAVIEPPFCARNAGVATCGVVSKMPPETVAAQPSAATCPGAFGEHDWARATSGANSASAEASALNKGVRGKRKLGDTLRFDCGQAAGAANRKVASRLSRLTICVPPKSAALGRDCFLV